MSIINFVLEPERAIILTDTLGYAGGKPAALVARKCDHNGAFAYAQRGYTRKAETFDAALAALWDVSIDAVTETIADQLGEPDRTHKLVLFGYSARRSRVRAIGFDWSGSSIPEVTEYPDGVHMIPGPPGVAPRLPLTATPEQLFRLGLAQFEVPRKMSVPYCVGGVAHLTTVDREGAGQHIHGLFPDYDEMVARFGDPNAEEVALWRRQHDRAAA